MKRFWMRMGGLFICDIIRRYGRHYAPILRHPEKPTAPTTRRRANRNGFASKGPRQPRNITKHAKLMRDLKLVTVCEGSLLPQYRRRMEAEARDLYDFGFGHCTRACAFLQCGHRPARIGSIRMSRTVWRRPSAGWASIMWSSRRSTATIWKMAAPIILRASLRACAKHRRDAPSKCSRPISGMKKTGRLGKSDQGHGPMCSIIISRPLPRLYPAIRPGERNFTSLNLLKRAKELDATIFTKSGLMVGLGETKEEIAQVMDTTSAPPMSISSPSASICSRRPSTPPSTDFVTPAWKNLRRLCHAGARQRLPARPPCSPPLTRSSHHAGDDLRVKLKRGRRRSQ